MNEIQIVKKIVDSRFEYTALKNGKKLGSIKGTVQNPKIVWLWRYKVLEKAEEAVIFEKLQKRFYADCQENESKVLLVLNPKTEQAKLFMDKSDFVVASVNYVFEHDLTAIGMPEKELKLIPFKEVELSKYQEVYYESSKGDPQVDLTNLSAKGLYEQDKEEISELWNEDLMYLVSANDEIIGVLNLRTMPHPTTKEQEGAINYMGLLSSARKKGYGKALHLTGLRKLQELGCKSYYGGTDSHNQAMLKIFEKNNCKRAEEQYCYKA